MRFALVAAMLLCAAQATPFDDVQTRAQAAQAAAEAALAAARDFVVDGAAAAATAAVEAAAAAADAAQASVNALVDAAQADGVAAAECGIAAAASLAKISTTLPVALGHCLTDSLHAFDRYAQRIAADFGALLAAVPAAAHDSAECWVNVVCQSRVYINLTAFEAKTSADVAFQLVQAEAAKLKLVASVAKCDVETKARALLDVARVAPSAAACVAAKRAELRAQS